MALFFLLKSLKPTPPGKIKMLRLNLDQLFHHRRIRYCSVFPVAHLRKKFYFRRKRIYYSQNNAFYSDFTRCWRYPIRQGANVAMNLMFVQQGGKKIALLCGWQRQPSISLAFKNFERFSPSWTSTQLSHLTRMFFTLRHANLPRRPRMITITKARKGHWLSSDEGLKLETSTLECLMLAELLWAWASLKKYGFIHLIAPWRIFIYKHRRWLFSVVSISIHSLHF